MKEFLVVFTKTNARILSNPSAKEIKYYKNAVLNPDMMQVRHVPPHFWKMDKYRNVMPMTPQEQKMRLALIAKNGMDNQIRRLSYWEFRPDLVLSYMRHTSSVMFFVAALLFSWGVLEEKYPGVIKEIKTNLNRLLLWIGL